MKKIWGWGMVVGAMFLLVSCGTKNVDSIHPLVRTADMGKNKTVVILPFSDYTPSDSPMEYWRRNVFIMESLQDEMLRYGYMPAVSENVLSYLSEKKIISNTSESKTRHISSSNKVIEDELAKEWSSGMKEELVRALALNAQKAKQKNMDGDSSKKFKSIALDNRAIRDIGRRFNADYVVRGRIIVFKNGLEDSFNPLQTGVLPFVFNTGQRTLFGFAESDQYELIDKMAIGGLIGAVAAPDTWPLDGDSETQLAAGHPRFGGGLVTTAENVSGWNSLIWGAAGSGLAYLADKGGRVDNAVVQLRMIVQDTKTGKIVWTNRAEVKSMTESAFNRQDKDSLLAQAVQQVCGRLFDNFVATENNRRIVRQYNDGSLYVTPVGGMTPEEDQCDPYHPIYVDSPAQVKAKRSTFQPLSKN